METNSSTSHSSPATEPRLTALWLFIVGVLVIETLLRIMPEGFMTRTVQHRAEEVRYLPPADIQFMGDSATSGVRVALIGKFIGDGTQVSNYALPGTSPLFNYFVLQRQIAAGRPPKMVVLAPHPFTWGDPFLDRFMARFATPEESLLFLRDGVKFSDWLYGTLCRLSYTLRYREELYKFITAGDTLFFKNLETPVSSVQNTRAKVSIDEQRPPEPTQSVLSKYNVPPLLRSQIVIHPYNRMYLDKFCALAAANNIKIAWLTLPLPEMLRRDFPNPDRLATYQRFVDEMKSRHPNLFTVSAGITEMPDTYYTDPWHMNPYGAWVFSQTAGEQLGAWLRTNPKK